MNLRYKEHYLPPVGLAPVEAATHRSDGSPAPASRSRARISRAIHFVLALILAIVFVPFVNAQSYTPADIVVPAGDHFRPDALNDQGEVAGGYTPAGGFEQPAVWRNGVFTNLPLLPGGVTGRARGINNVGQMVGACGILKPDGTYPSRACVWENGTVRALASVAGTTESAAWAINDVGTIVGHVYTPLAVNGPFREAVIWKGSTVAKLIPPTAGARTWARAIDSTGRVAVSWTTKDEYSWEWYPARWTPNVPNGTSGTMTTLGTWGAAYDINDSGVVSGNQGSDAVVWDGSTATYLDNFYWGMKSANGINNAGSVVGSNYDFDAEINTAWVAYSPDDMQDLNLLLTYSSTFAYPGSLYGALSINNTGQILVNTGNGTYTLLTPSSQPPGPQNPAPPIYVWAYPNDGTVDLYWPPVYYATSYHVKRSTVSGGPYTTIATDVPWNGFTDTSVVNGTTYYYVVSSVNGAYESADSPETAAQPLGVVPVAPASVSASAGNSVVNVNWSYADYATSYNVKRSTVSGGPYTTIAAGVVGLDFTDTSVVNGTRYYYVVSSQDGAYESGNSAQVSAMPLATPVAPTNLSAAAKKGGKSVSLAWQQSTSPEIRFNRVYRSVNGGLFTQVAQISAGTAYVNSNLTRNTTYSYGVTAINVNGQEGPFSNTVSIRTR